MPRAAREVSVASKKANILIRKGRVIDPASGRDEIADLLIENGRHGGSVAGPVARQVMDAWLLDDNGQLDVPPVFQEFLPVPTEVTP